MKTLIGSGKSDFNKAHEGSEEQESYCQVLHQYSMSCHTGQEGVIRHMQANSCTSCTTVARQNKAVRLSAESVKYAEQPGCSMPETFALKCTQLYAFSVHQSVSVTWCRCIFRF